MAQTQCTLISHGKSKHVISDPQVASFPLAIWEPKPLLPSGSIFNTWFAKVALLSWLHQASESRKSMAPSCLRWSWAERDIAFAHTPLSRTNHVTRPHQLQSRLGNAVQLYTQREGGIHSMNTGLVLHSHRADHVVRKVDPMHGSNSSVTPLRYKQNEPGIYHLAGCGSR